MDGQMHEQPINQLSTNIVICISVSKNERRQHKIIHYIILAINLLATIFLGFTCSVHFKQSYILFTAE